MPFKFTLLGLEVNNCKKKPCKSNSQTLTTDKKPKDSGGKTMTKKSQYEEYLDKAKKQAKTVEGFKRKYTKSKKVTDQRKKFTKAVQHCHKVTKGRKSFGKCMRKRLKK